MVDFIDAYRNKWGSFALTLLRLRSAFVNHTIFYLRSSHTF